MNSVSAPADHRLSEFDRRLSALEARHMELVQEVATHGAVCVERQKMTLNTLAAIQGMVEKLDKRLDELAGATTRRLDGWLAAVASAGLLSTGSLVFLILTRGLK